MSGLHAITTIWSVSQLTSRIREMLEADPELGSVWVEGEATNVSRSQAGHVYFSLRDADAVVKCVLFRSYARLQNHLPENGEAILVHGYISVYEQAGSYQLYVDELRLLGDGALQREFREVYERLAREGLFAESRKRALPVRPRCVGVITSPTGAVWHDIQTVLRRRYPLAHVLLAPAQMQGTGASESITAALELLNRDGRADVIVIARGGGSLEDLWCFNEEALVRAVFRSRIPVVSAIGHETDVTLCDFVADMRAPTPSAAAEMIAPDQQTLRAELTALAGRLVTSITARVQQARERVEKAVSRLEQVHPRRRTDRGRLQLDQLGSRLQQQLLDRTQAARRHLVILNRQLQLLHPHGPLQRGYALVIDRTTGHRRRLARDLTPGECVTLAFIDGTAAAQVTSVKLESGGS